jgi:hypothetical protein
MPLHEGSEGRFVSVARESLQKFAVRQFARFTRRDRSAKAAEPLVQ